MHNNGGVGRFELGILYILFQIVNVGLNEIPYVTLITIIGQVRVILSMLISLVFLR